MYRYFIEFLNNRFQVNPLGSGKIKNERDGEEIFFRNKLAGEVLFTKDDFKLLYGLEQSADRCAEIAYIIERKCTEGYQEFWRGIFSANEGKWNASLCKVSFSIRPDDPYRKIKDYYGKEFNALEVPASVTVQAKLDFSYQFEFKDVTGDTAFEHGSTWAVFLQERYWIDGDWNTQGKFQNVDILFRLITTRPFVNGFPVDLDGWEIVETNNQHQIAKYARLPDLYNFKPYVWRFQSDFEKYPELRQINCGQTFDQTKYIRAYNLNDPNGCYNIRKNIDNNRWMSLIWEFGVFSFNRNRKLLDVVWHLVKRINPTAAPQRATDISEFFTSDTNYATGIENQVKDLLIAHKSDIVSWNSSEAATKGMISLKSILDSLRDMFQVYWFLDGNGKFRMEHISFFESIGELDLSVPKYSKHLEGKLAYEYDKTKMPRFERLLFNETTSEDFAKGEIEYSSSCVNYEEGQDSKERTVSAFTTDLENLIVSASGSRSGFVLIAHKAGVVRKEEGQVTGKLQNNGHLSAANLTYWYYDHNRILISGIVNEKPKTFKSTIKTKKQAPFSVPFCCGMELNPFFRYITNLGAEGSLLNSEHDLKTDFVTLEIIHPTFGSGLFVSGRQFDDSFSKSFR